MSKYYSLQIDVTKIDKKLLFAGKKGTYLNCFLAIEDKPDSYGQVGMVTQSISQEERKKGAKGNILGNLKPINSKSDGLPF
jgi:hypothetical protein